MLATSHKHTHKKTYHVLLLHSCNKASYKAHYLQLHLSKQQTTETSQYSVNTHFCSICKNITKEYIFAPTQDVKLTNKFPTHSNLCRNIYTCCLLKTSTNTASLTEAKYSQHTTVFPHITYSLYSNKSTNQMHHSLRFTACRLTLKSLN